MRWFGQLARMTLKLSFYVNQWRDDLSVYLGGGGGIWRYIPGSTWECLRKSLGALLPLLPLQSLTWTGAWMNKMSCTINGTSPHPPGSVVKRNKHQRTKRNGHSFEITGWKGCKADMMKESGKLQVSFCKLMVKVIDMLTCILTRVLIRPRGCSDF